jgi:hypothetical protein
MRRTLALIVILTMSVLAGGCGKSDTSANANNANGDDGITGPGQTVSNANMAPTGGPGPEPENAGSAAKSDKSDSGNKAAKSNSNKKK